MVNWRFYSWHRTLKVKQAMGVFLEEVAGSRRIPSTKRVVSDSKENGLWVQYYLKLGERKWQESAEYWNADNQRTWINRRKDWEF
jgi:hypothetical protein